MRQKYEYLAFISATVYPWLGISPCYLSVNTGMATSPFCSVQRRGGASNARGGRYANCAVWRRYPEEAHVPCSRTRPYSVENAGRISSLRQVSRSSTSRKDCSTSQAAARIADSAANRQCRQVVEMVGL